MPNCSIENCERKYYALGYCGLHWRRVRKNGTPDGGDTTHAPPEVRFWRGVVRGGQNDCWPYVRGAKRGVYGLFQAGGKGSPSIGCHRYSYGLHKGEIPKGMVVMHSCDNPRCVNPAHLSLGTYRDNTQDMIAKGRHARMAPKGEASGVAVLTEDAVRMIRASSETNASLARQLGVSINAVRGVRIGRTWSHVI